VILGDYGNFLLFSFDYFIKIVFVFSYLCEEFPSFCKFELSSESSEILINFVTNLLFFVEIEFLIDSLMFLFFYICLNNSR